MNNLNSVTIEDVINTLIKLKYSPKNTTVKLKPLRVHRKPNSCGDVAASRDLGFHGMS